MIVSKFMLATYYEKSGLSGTESIIFSAFEQMEGKLDCRIPKSFVPLVVLFISIKGRINFLQLKRFSERCESGFRYFFERSFDSLSLERLLLRFVSEISSP